MLAYHHRLTVPLAPALGGALGLVVAIGVAVAPRGLLESLVMRSALPAVVAAAQPPLGVTARVLLVLVGGGVAALFAGLSLWVVFGARRLPLRPVPLDPEMPHLRRADSHPDAPPRPPVRAHRDLGAPMTPLLPERPLPVDLDLPLAVYDPSALLNEPRAPTSPVAPLAHFERPQLIDPGDRFETFDPAPAAPEIEPATTLEALLDRLEQGIQRRPRPMRGRALGDLR